MAKQSLGCARPTRGWQPVQAHHHHFPHELHNSMGPEMGMHLWLREPPFLWKLPLSCFKHYSDALFVRLCANVFLTAHVCEGWGQCECVVYFYYVAGHTARICLRVNAHTLVVCLRPCMCVRWGQQSVTTGWWGTALLLTKEASGCESVPTRQTCGHGIRAAAPVPR